MKTPFFFLFSFLLIHSGFCKLAKEGKKKNEAKFLAAQIIMMREKYSLLFTYGGVTNQPPGRYVYIYIYIRAGVDIVT